MIVEQNCGPIGRESIEGISPDLLKTMYRDMVRIRLFEEVVAGLVEERKVQTPCHLYIGQEAVAVGVCARLNRDDFVYSTHRSHGHYLAKGGDLNALMAEIFCRSNGCSFGYGGSMHICDPGRGLPGSSAIVGGTIPAAVGTAFAFDYEKNGGVAVAFFGDGAATEGVLYESLNFAMLKKLPAVFICENNFYSTHMHITKIQSNTGIAKRAESFGIPASTIDGNNIVEVYRAAGEAVERARGGGGPSFIECLTYRWRGHVGPNWDIEKGIREKKEVDWWIGNCAIERLRDLLDREGILKSGEKEKIRLVIEKEIDEALVFAQEGPFPDPAGMNGRVFR